MRAREYGSREYRILALAVIFFLIGLFFFLHNNSGSLPSGNTPKSPAAAQPLMPQFANDPDPGSFRTFTYDGAMLNNNPSLTVSAVCHDAYVAVLVFPDNIDYRSSVNRYVYNKAIPCSPGATVNIVIMPTDFGNLAYGTYYFFTADEGSSGAWYNPK